LLTGLLPTGAATVATLIFALDEAHNVPVSWLANRSTLVAAAFGCLALEAHLSAREHGVRSAVGRAALWWTLSFAAGEYAFGMAAYAVAYELWRGRANGRLRGAALGALGLPVIVFLVTRAAVGHSVHASGYYIEPTDLRYLSMLPTRALAGLSELGLGIDAGWVLSAPPARDMLLMALYQRGLLTPGLWQALPSWIWLQSLLGVVALGGLVLIVSTLRKRAQEPERLAHLSWLIAGSGLAVLASCGALPSSRLLVSAELGAAAVLGAALVALGGALRSPTRGRRAATLAFAAIAVVHLALPVRADLREIEGRRERASATRRRAFELPLPRSAPDAAQLDVVLISATDFGTEVMLPWIRQLHGLSTPQRWQRLSGAQAAHDLRRLDDHTLELKVLAGRLEGTFAVSLHRSAEQPIAAGEHFEAGAFRVEVLEARDGNPARFAVRFERALDDPRLVLLHAFSDGMRRFQAPPPGQTLRLPVASQPWAVR
jgi:hypothetical protein